MQRLFLLLTFFSTIGLSTLSSSFFSQIHASETAVPPARAERMEKQGMAREAGAQGEMRQEMMQNGEQAGDKAQGEANGMRSQQMKQAVQNHAKRLEYRFTEVYSVRLKAMIGKIDARLELMSTTGSDVEDAQKKLGEADAELKAAEEAIQTAITALQEIDPEAEDAKESVLEAKDMVTAARERYKVALELAKEAVQLAKEAN